MSDPWRQREEIGAATLYLGDCLEILPALGAVDHVITDPPYSEHTHAKSRAGGPSDLLKDGHMASYSRAVDLGFEAISPETRATASAMFAECCARWCAVFSDIEGCGEWRSALTGAGLDYCRTGIWVKLNATPQFTGDRPATGAEVITLAHAKGRKRWNGGGRPAVWTFPIELNRGGANPRLHTTQKPLPLMDALVADFAARGELIADPFMGSGTTGVAAVQQGRRFVGIEREPEYFRIACERIDAAQRQGRLFA